MSHAHADAHICTCTRICTCTSYATVVTRYAHPSYICTCSHMCMFTCFSIAHMKTCHTGDTCTRSPTCSHRLACTHAGVHTSSAASMGHNCHAQFGHMKDFFTHSAGASRISDMPKETDTSLRHIHTIHNVVRLVAHSHLCHTLDSCMTRPSHFSQIPTAHVAPHTFRAHLPPSKQTFTLVGSVTIHTFHTCDAYTPIHMHSKGGTQPQQSGHWRAFTRAHIHTSTDIKTFITFSTDTDTSTDSSASKELH